MPRTFQCITTIKTGISDFHELVVTALKTFHKKQRPKIIHYRNYKNFENDNFRQNLKKELLKFDVTNAPLSKFTATVLSVLNKHAPKKLKYICSNNCNFMTKQLRKAIMNRLKLRNKFSKLETRNLKGAFIAKEISVLACSAKLKDVFFGKIDHRVVSNDRKFWKTVGPLFSEKAFHKESIILNNSNKTISNNEELAEPFNKHFSKLVASNIASSDITDPVFNAIKKHENHQV